MAWQRIDTDPLDIDTGVAPAHARAIADALVRHALPLLRLAEGRAEPLASAALFHLDGRVVLLTCRHIFDDGVALGDLAVPRAHGFGVLGLAQLAARVIGHPQRDLALIELAPGRRRDELLRQWPAVPLADDALADFDLADEDAAVPSLFFVLAGWPYAQMRRVESIVYARPVVFFAPAAPGGDGLGLRVRYARVARRSDGVHVHAPALDGVSGATLWAVRGVRGDMEAGQPCVLRPVAVQCAFKHDAYARAEPWRDAGGLLERVLRR